MNAVILAGGFGSRLSPLTDSVPKPMLTIANRPCLDYTASGLIGLGIKEITLTLGYLPEQIIQWAIGYRDITCRFSLENIPLGTAGGVRAVSNFLDDIFIVASGDSISDVDYMAMLDSHLKTGAMVTMAVKEVAGVSQYGVCEVEQGGRIVGFREKPQDIEVGLVNTGTYIISKAAIIDLPLDTKIDFSLDLFPKLLQRGQLYAFTHRGYWRDIGSIDSFLQANFELASGTGFRKSRNFKSFRFTSIRMQNNLVAHSSDVLGKIDGCIIGSGAVVDRGVVLENCVVLEGARVSESHFGAIIGKDFVVEQTIGGEFFASEPAREGLGIRE